MNKGKIFLSVTAIALLVSLMLSTSSVNALFTGGKGVLAAKGIGTAVIQGSGTVFIQGGGILEVENYGGHQPQIVTKGSGNVFQRGNFWVYEGEGMAQVTGENLIVHIKTTHTVSKVLAYGTGWVCLKGEGVFKTWHV